MESLKKNFGMRVKELRRSVNLTQEQLAEKIDMDTQNLCKMENGNHFPQSKNLVKIAAALNVEIKDLFNFGHFLSRERITEDIIEYIRTAKTEDLQLIHKIIKDIQQYVR